MSVPTLLKLIEEQDVKHQVVKILIGGTELPVWTSCTYNFAIGSVPTATIIVPNLASLPSAVKEESSVQIWFGYRHGISSITGLVFGGGVVDSVGNDGATITIEVVMRGARKLTYSYNRRIIYDFDVVSAEEAVTALMALAGVTNFAVDLDPWLIGTEVPQTIQFSTYGEAINKVSEVDGSPWYAMPSGLIRVDKRDPLPSPSARRTIFASVVTGIIESQPEGIENPLARPRILDESRRKLRDEVANFIEVDGAVVTTTGPSGEQNSEQIVETVDGLSGQFPNGAYWIPTPPLFQDFTFSNELIDTPEKAFIVAERYFDLKNRLLEELSISMPGDPDIFLGMTVRVKDPSYSGLDSLYFIKGYSTSLTPTASETQLQLVGGDEAGTTGFAKPFADFIWTYDANITPGSSGGPGGKENPIENPPNTETGAKLCEDFPEQTDETDAEDEQDPTDPEEDVSYASDTPGNAVVYIGLNGTVSQDFDGYIVSWIWTWTDHLDVEHTVSGPRWTLIINPEDQSSVEVTLTVTDNSGRSDSITKTVRTSVNYVPNGSNPDQPYDPTDGEEDSEDGGGNTTGPCSEPEFPCPYPPCDEAPVSCEGSEKSFLVAAKTVGMASLDNRTWNDLTKAAVDADGDFISVDGGVNNTKQTAIIIFGTSAGEIIRSIDNCETGTKVFTVPGGPRIECIHFDTEEMGESGGEIPDASETPSNGEVPVYTFASPGTLTMVQAYQQCRLLGFSHDTAIVAVAIMVRESGLYSKAMNTAGNTPPSTDRGIAQWNDYYHPDISDADAYNTRLAIQWMYKKSSGGSDWSPWNVRGGSHLTGTNVGAVVAAVSGSGDGGIVTPDQPTPDVAPSGMKIWAGTSDGRIYKSDDSGKTWTLHVDFGDGYPILQIGTPPRFGAQTSSLWAFGGDTSDITSLVRIDPAKSGEFVSLDIQGALKEAVIAAGGGAAVRSSMNDTASILVFNNSVMTERVWTSLDPLGDSASWIPCGVTSNIFNTVAPGFAGDFVIAGNTVMKTRDNENFTGLGAGPDTINHMIWRGLPGMYTAAMDSGLYQTVDFGDAWGPLRPNASFGNTWPAGAEAKQVAVSMGARHCEEPTPEPCDDAPRYEAAAGVQISPEYFTNGQKLSDSIFGISATIPDTALVTTYYEGSAHHKNMGKKSSQGLTLEISVTPTIIDSFLFLAVVSRPGDEPDSVTDSQSLTWELVQSEIHSDGVGDIRLSIYRTNANAESKLGLDITVTFLAEQDVILAIADEWIGLTTTPGSDPVTDSTTDINADTTPVTHPDDYLLEYVFSNTSANFNQGNVTPPSFGIALQLEACGGLGLLFALEGQPSGDLVIGSYISGTWAEVSRPAGLVTSGLIFNTFFEKLGDNHWLVVNDNPNNRLYKSTDGGITFAQKLITSEFGLPICQAADGTLWAHANTAGTGKIYKSIDDGENWTEEYTIIDTPFPLIESAFAHPTDENTIVFTGISAGGLPFVVVTTDGSTFAEFTLGTDPDGFSQYETMASRFLANGRFIFLAQVNAGSDGRVDGWWTDTPGNSGSYVAEIVGPVLTTNDYGCDALTALSPKGEPIFAVVSPCTAKGIRIFRSTDAENWTEISVAGLPASFPAMAVFYSESEDILYVWGFPGPSDNLWALAEASGAATSWSQITGAGTAISETSAFAFTQMNITEI